MTRPSPAGLRPLLTSQSSLLNSSSPATIPPPSIKNTSHARDPPFSVLPFSRSPILNHAHPPRRPGLERHSPLRRPHSRRLPPPVAPPQRLRRHRPAARRLGPPQL